MQPSDPQCHITWRTTPPSPAQLAAWDRLWARLLGQTGPKTQGPQEMSPGASNVAVAGNNRHLWSE